MTLINKPIATKSGLVTALLISLASFSFALPRLPARVISLAGLVVNAQTLSPLESAKILDDGGHILGTTDKNGYYKISINYTKTGEIHFKLKIAKQGFGDFIQNEHWGNLGDAQNIVYFGLNDLHSNAKSFSSFSDDTKSTNDLGYDSVLRQFDKVKKEREFDGKLESVKAGNENVLVQVEGRFYIVDSNGWIALNSDKDPVSVDNKQVLSADKLNAVIKRKNVKGMTPVDSKEAKFLIYTK